MEQDNRLLQHLLKNPGLTARDIADDFDLDKSDCLRDLRKLEQRAKVYQDASYRWWIGKKSENEELRLPIQEPDDEKVQRLAQYYLDCITQDIQDGIKCFADSKYNLDYAELPMFPRSMDEWRKALQTTDVHSLLSRRVPKDRDKKLSLIGYPVLLKHVVAKSGWKGYFIVPVLYQRLESSSAHTDAAGQSFNDAPILNPQALQDLSGLRRSDLINELMHLSEELGLNSDAYYGEIDEIVERLQLLRPSWPWREDMRPEATSKGLPIRELQEEGIYNRCTIMLVKRPPYTVGLETELLQLSKASKSLWQGTALDDWVNAKATPVQTKRSQPLIEIVPLNTEQRAAVEQGLSRPLTVVTGPPGTGKSQVVLSLLLNAAWQGQTALFASKNNKAIDVVETRVNALGSRPSLLRLGRGDIQAALSEYLISLLSVSATDEDRSSFERAKRSHEEIKQRFEQVTAELESIVKLRNSVDHHEKLVEPLRTRLGHMQFLAYKSLDKDKIGGELRTMVAQLRRADKEAQPITVRLAWFLVKQQRYRELAKCCQNFIPTLETLKQTPPAEPPGDKSISKWRSFVEDVQHSFDDASAIQEYFALLDTLQSMRSIEACYREYTLLIEQMSAVSHTLWKLWLRIQPDRLSKEERGKLQEYSTIIQMRVSADEEGRPLRKSSFHRLQDLFPKVIRSLPCWAVTSLSARGRLPLEGGLFDFLIIDEASQCDIASALPLLLRAKRVVIIGDPMQLRHITGLRKQKDQQLLARHGLIDTPYIRWAYSVNSLFDVASGLCDKEDIINLRDHHRSHADIISFSNEEFYEGRLRIATKYDKLRMLPGEGPVVRWVDVQGEVRRLSGGVVNYEEAQKVVEVLAKIVLEQEYSGSIGVVSPFRGQANRILDLVKQRPELHRQLNVHEFESETVHSFQGDERDLMIFSPVISHGVDERGFLERNPNLFNVAITRARSALVVVGDRQAALESGVKYLERFARYVKQIEHKTEPRSQEAAEIGEDYAPLDRGQWVSDWEIILQRALQKAGVNILPQYPVDKYVLDFAVLVGDRKLDIEVDGERYHRDWDGELLRRDRLRNMRMFELGWDVMRFWVYQVRDELEWCTERVLNWVQKAKVEQSEGSGSVSIEK